MKKVDKLLALANSINALSHWPRDDDFYDEMVEAQFHIMQAIDIIKKKGLDDV